MAERQQQPDRIVLVHVLHAVTDYFYYNSHLALHDEADRTVAVGGLCQIVVVLEDTLVHFALVFVNSNTTTRIAQRTY